MWTAKSTVRGRLHNNINPSSSIRSLKSQAIKKFLQEKIETWKNKKCSKRCVLDNPYPAWTKMISNPAPDPINSQKIRIRDSGSGTTLSSTASCFRCSGKLRCLPVCDAVCRGFPMKMRKNQMSVAAQALKCDVIGNHAVRLQLSIFACFHLI